MIYMSNTATTTTTFQNRISLDILEMISETDTHITLRRVWSCDELDAADGIEEMDRRIAALVLNEFDEA